MRWRNATRMAVLAVPTWVTACGQNPGKAGSSNEQTTNATPSTTTSTNSATSANTTGSTSASSSVETASASSAGGALGTVGSTSSNPQGGTTTTAASSSGGMVGVTSGAGGAGSGGMSSVDSGGNTGSGGGSAGSGGGPAGVRVVGRTSPGSNGGLRFSWPGVNIHARFTGTQVSMDLDDGDNLNRFTVTIDGGAPQTVTASGQGSTPLASGLAEGTHELVIWRNTEAAMGVSEFVGLSGFSSGSGLTSPPPAPDRRIEVIGDSLSVGAGAEGTTTDCSPNIDAFTNNYVAYGSIAARRVDADLVTIAWSGIGVFRSYSASDPTMPERYDYAVPNETTPWDFSNYQPHVVVLNLGTNDFGSGDPGQPYVDAYVDFIGHVRELYQSAYLILIDMYGAERLTALENVLTTLQDAGESDVEIVSFNAVSNNNTACNQHPNTTAHEAMGNILAERLEAVMQW